MSYRRLGLAAAGVLAAACALTGCGSSSRAWSVVALGDSVPRGTNCDCTPYPQLSAASATNDSVAGYTSSNVLAQLQSDHDVIDHVSRARVVEIEVGANDVAYSGSCGTSIDCYAPKVPKIEKNLDAIVHRVDQLAVGDKPLVMLLDYWSVWLGGQYAAAHGDAYVAAATEMTDRVDDVIKATAEKTGSAYVDLRAAFKGPDYAYDETHYLSDDGDHPNAAGHKQIAAAAEAVIERQKAPH